MGKRLSIRGVGSLLKCGSGEEVDGEDCEESVEEVDGDRRHSFKVHGTKFSVDKRYTFVKSLGTGAYGVVCSAMDSVREGAVAIKYIPDVFSNLSDARRILREVRVTQRLTHINLIQVIDLDTEAAYHEYKDVYMTTELMDTDLRRIIDKEKGLLSEQTKYITYQMLRALQYLHSAHIYHRDVKPANVLVNRSCDIKLADFGLSRYVDPLNDVAKTDYVVTRWYRAPEVILSRKYTSAIDIWSVGCILVEMLSGKVLFKGKDGKDQISLICKTLGKPTAAETAHVTSRNAREFLASLPESEGVSFRELVKHSSSSAMFQAEVADLLEHMLVFDPRKRVSAKVALQHSWFNDFRDAKHERDFEGSHAELIRLEPPAEKDLDKDDLRHLLWAEVQKFRPGGKYSSSVSSSTHSPSTASKTNPQANNKS